MKVHPIQCPEQLPNEPHPVGWIDHGHSRAWHNAIVRSAIRDGGVLPCLCHDAGFTRQVEPRTGNAQA